MEKPIDKVNKIEPVCESLWRWRYKNQQQQFNNSTQRLCVMPNKISHKNNNYNHDDVDNDDDEKSERNVKAKKP